MNKINKESIVWVDGSWHEGSYPVMSAMSQSYMHGSTVFDGARAFSNCVPDLDMPVSYTHLTLPTSDLV